MRRNNILTLVSAAVLGLGFTINNIAFADAATTAGSTSGFIAAYEQVFLAAFE